MKKDEILKRSRELDQGEGLNHAQNQALKIGATAFSFISLVLIIATTFSIVFAESNDWITMHALFAPLNAYFASLFHGFYCFKRKKADLVWTILLVAASLTNLIVFFVLLFRA